jgi:hypothetical protein
MNFNQYFCNESQAYLGLTEILGTSGGIYTDIIDLKNGWSFNDLIINPPLWTGQQIIIITDLQHNRNEIFPSHIRNTYVATYNIFPDQGKFSALPMEIKFSAQNIIRRIFL